MCGVQPLQHADEAHAADEARLCEGGPLGRGDRAALERLHAARLHTDAVVHRGLGQQADHVDVFAAAEDRHEALGVDGAGQVAVVLQHTHRLWGRWRTSTAERGRGDVQLVQPRTSVSGGGEHLDDHHEGSGHVLHGCLHCKAKPVVR